MLPTGAMRRRIYRHLGWNGETGSASIQQCPTAHPGGVKCSRGGLSYFGLRCLVESRNQLSTVDTKATGATTFAPLVRLTPPLSKTQLATYADQGCLHCSNRWLCCARATRVCTWHAANGWKCTRRAPLSNLGVYQKRIWSAPYVDSGIE